MLKEEIKKFFKGEVKDDKATLSAYSLDASLFEVRPKLVAFPKDSGDLKELVRYVGLNKEKDPTLSITVRAAGSDMTGGPLNESIIVDVTKYMNQEARIMNHEAVVEPGVFYRDFEKKSLRKGLLLPCYTASKNLCAIGGMIGNNSGGEKTLRWGKMENYILESKVLFSDGKEYVIKPLNKEELERKIREGGFEGDIYKKIYELISNNREEIELAKPKVSKNSAGYYIWNVWDGTTFDLNKLIVGSQGTLGIVTEVRLKLVPVEPVSKLFVIFLHKLDHMADLVNEILPTKPESIESYDSATMKLAFRFLPEMIRSMKIKSFGKLLFSFIPEIEMMVRGGVPKLILLVEYGGQSEEEVNAKMRDLKERTSKFHYAVRMTRSIEESNKYWTVRRESFNLLRNHTQGKRTAPFVDDVVVRPEDMPAFLPEMRAILDEYKMVYTIAGHAGNGNFHIIPLLDMRDRGNVSVIKEVSGRVYDLVAKYKGSITGEHNDGIIRTPYLFKMYSPRVLGIFKEIKDIFDPKNIFNPGKKVPSTGSGQGGSIEYMASHIRIEP